MDCFVFRSGRIWLLAFLLQANPIFRPLQKRVKTGPIREGKNRARNGRTGGPCGRDRSAFLGRVGRCGWRVQGGERVSRRGGRVGCRAKRCFFCGRRWCLSPWTWMGAVGHCGGDFIDGGSGFQGIFVLVLGFWLSGGAPLVVEVVSQGGAETFLVWSKFIGGIGGGEAREEEPTEGVDLGHGFLGQRRVKSLDRDRTGKG
ncbi:hypothetical protein SLA2020_118290 [Shorea laevis]